MYIILFLEFSCRMFSYLKSKNRGKSHRRYVSLGFHSVPETFPGNSGAKLRSEDDQQSDC